MYHFNKRLSEALAFVRDSGADIFCLQEVPEQFLPQLKELPYHTAAVKEVDFVARRKAATSYIVTLSRYPITGYNSVTLPIPERRPLTSRILYAVGLWALATDNRHCSMAKIALPEGPLHVFNLHLSLTHPERRASEFELSMVNYDRNIPSFICGDFNILEKPHVAPLNWLLGGRPSDTLRWRRERTHIEVNFASYELTNALADTNTHPISRSQLDHILVSHDFTIKNAHVIPERYGSDHHPISVEIEA